MRQTNLDDELWAVLQKRAANAPRGTKRAREKELQAHVTRMLGASRGKKHGHDANRH